MGRPNLRMRREIGSIRNSGRIFRGRWVHIRIGASDQDQTLISVRKKFGKAVSRNRIRRQIRTLCRELIPKGHLGFLLVISVGDRSLGVSYGDLRQDLLGAFQAFDLL